MVLCKLEERLDLREQFYPFVKELPGIVFPVLLLVDGATSHISIEVSGTNLTLLLLLF